MRPERRIPVLSPRVNGSRNRALLTAPPSVTARAYSGKTAIAPYISTPVKNALILARVTFRIFIMRGDMMGSGCFLSWAIQAIKKSRLPINKQAVYKVQPDFSYKVQV